MTTQVLSDIHVRRLHPQQALFVNSTAKRIIVRAGRRGGKTTGMAQRAVRRFLAKRRQLYGTPTSIQLDAFWSECLRALAEPVAKGELYVNKTEHIIEVPNTKQRIRAITCWEPDHLRGDYADDLYLDEFQLMSEDTWRIVGEPMLLDHDGAACFIYTPPSLFSSGISKARDPRHAAKMFRAAMDDKTGQWATFHFTSHDNPYISQEALGAIALSMDRNAYRQEILAEDDDAEAALLVYSMFNERTQLIDPFPIPREWPRFVGHDFGMSNPAALWVALDPGGNLYVYDEYLPGPGRSAYQHVEEFQRKAEGVTVLKRIGGNATTEDEIRQAYTAHGWPISAPKWTKPAQQIGLTQGIMQRNRVFVFKRCARFVDELRNCLWETDNDGVRLDKIRDEARYHLLACARYLFSDFSVENAAAMAPARFRRAW